MKREDPPLGGEDPHWEIPALIQTLLESERRLEQLTGGEVDSVMDRDGRPIVFRRAQGQLRDNEAARHSAVLDALPAHIALLDATGLIVSVNEGWRRISCADALLNPGYVVGLNYLDICDRASAEGSPEAHDAAEGIRSVLSRKESTFSLEYPCHSPTAQQWFLLTVTPLAGEPSQGVVVMHLDVTGRKRAELRLIHSEEEYRLLFDSNPHAMWVFDAETLAFLAVNDAAVELYGFSREEFLEMTIEELRPAQEVPALPDALPSLGDARNLPAPQTKHSRKDGSLLDIVGVTNPIEFRGRRARLVLATDVTEKKLLEAQLRHAQKMDAVGRLAAGVAHDFNNSLGVILGYTELLLRKAGEAERGRLEQILKATQRSATLTRQLLAFSRKQVVDLKVLDVNALLLDLEEMLERLIGEDIDLTIVRGPDVGHLKADHGQLEQVVVNLCVNARDAMPRGGRLRIDTSTTEVLSDEARKEPMAPGRYVVIAVSDTGVGIEKEHLARIFEPFFTTKEMGKGTGLGLAMVYGIVKQAGGYVWVDSALGRGSTFRLYLPRLDEPADRPPRPDPVLPSGGGETILLVEDEESLREITSEMLREQGYHVLQAAGPLEALEIARTNPEVIHLVLTDVVMPGMDGRSMAAKLLAERGPLPVLYMSGYTDDVVAHHGVFEWGTRLLEKPFTAAALLEGVRASLACANMTPQDAPLD